MARDPLNLAHSKNIVLAFYKVMNIFDIVAITGAYSKIPLFSFKPPPSIKKEQVCAHF